jgi:hypothetical protein
LWIAGLAVVELAVKPERRLEVHARGGRLVSPSGDTTEFVQRIGGASDVAEPATQLQRLGEVLGRGGVIAPEPRQPSDLEMHHREAADVMDRGQPIEGRIEARGRRVAAVELQLTEGQRHRPCPRVSAIRSKSIGACSSTGAAPPWSACMSANVPSPNAAAARLAVSGASRTADEIHRRPSVHRARICASGISEIPRRTNDASWAGAVSAHISAARKLSSCAIQPGEPLSVIGDDQVRIGGVEDRLIEAQVGEVNGMDVSAKRLGGGESEVAGEDRKRSNSFFLFSRAADSSRRSWRGRLHGARRVRDRDGCQQARAYALDELGSRQLTCARCDEFDRERECIG